MRQGKVYSAAPLEVRETDRGPTLHGVLIQEGRAAQGGRAELFAPDSIIWPAEGVAIRTGHGQPSEVRALPTRAPSGEIRIAAKATPALVKAITGGKAGMSVEFIAMQEERTKGGVREIQRAFVDGAALVADPEYHQGRAEVRERRNRKGAPIWL